MKNLFSCKEKHGSTCVPQRFILSDGFKLGSWVSVKRNMRKSGRLWSEWKRQLDEIGFVWDARALRGREAANPFTPASDEFALVAASGGSGA